MAASSMKWKYLSLWMHTSEEEEVFGACFLFGFVARIFLDNILGERGENEVEYGERMRFEEEVKISRFEGE